MRQSLPRRALGHFGFLRNLAFHCFINTLQMAAKYSDLELALNTLVSEFHKAADNKPKMNTTQFQTMLSNQMPTLSKSTDSEEGLGKILEKMGVQSGEDVSFKNFWSLINSQAQTLFDNSPKNKSVKCSCSLQ